MNIKWRKYNQEFFGGFQQFEMKDLMRKCLQLDTPVYFLKADHDLKAWMEAKYPEGLDLTKDQDLNSAKHSALNEISNGLSQDFMKDKHTESAFSYEAMYAKKKQNKNLYLQDLRRKITDHQHNEDNIDILTLDRFIDGIFFNRISEEFGKVLVKKNTLIQNRNLQHYLLLKIHEHVCTNSDVDITKESFNILKDTYDKILKESSKIPTENLILILNTASKITTKISKSNSIYQTSYLDHERFEDFDLWQKCLKMKESEQLLSLNKNVSLFDSKNFSWNLAKARIKSSSLFQGINIADEPKLTLPKDKLTIIIKDIAYILYRLNLPFETSAKLLVSLCYEKGYLWEDTEQVQMVYEKLCLKEQFDKACNNYSLKVGRMSSNNDNKENRVDCIAKCISFVVKYLETKDILQQLSVNKILRKYVKETILPIWLDRKNYPVNVRIELWTMFLFEDEFCLKKFLNPNVREEDMPKEADIIDLDLNRTKAAQEDPQHLKSLRLILKNFVIKYRDTTSYFQGLNFLTSFLMKVFKSEELSYRMLNYLNENIYAYIFNKKDEKQLPLVFYQFDRLVEIYFPNLSDHFYRERISSDQYASPFLITLFTTMASQEQDCGTIQEFWDIILSEKQIGVFKILQTIQHIFYDKFMEMKFEEYQMFWIDLPQKPHFVLNSKFIMLMNESKVNNKEDMTDEAAGDKVNKDKSFSVEMEIGDKMRRFKQQTKLFHIDQGILDGLKGEYNHVKHNANQFWQKFHTNKLG